MLARGGVIVCLLLLTVACPEAEKRVGGDERRYRFTADWTTDKTVQWTEHLAGLVGKPGVRGVEIGCFEGRSTIWFVENVLTHPTSHMSCVDVFTKKIEERFDHNIEVSGLGDRITKLKGYSQDVLRTLEPNSIDFAYIDGCHLASCVLTDAVLLWDPLKAGGIMVFDDYVGPKRIPPLERPQLGVDAFMEVFSGRFRLKHKGYQVILEKTEGRSRKELVGTPLVHSPLWERRSTEENPKVVERGAGGAPAPGDPDAP